MAASDKNLIAQSSNKFGWDMYQHLASNRQGNLIFSPFSIHTALSMTRQGARGDTDSEMKKTLHIPHDVDLKLISDNFMELLKIFTTETDGFILSQGNRLFIQSDYKLLDDFTNILNEIYKADVGLVDFIKNTEGSRTTINNWVEEQTRKKIQNLIQQGVLNSDVRAVLVNAVYFKGEWARQFNPSNTAVDSFYTEMDKPIDVDMMSAKGTFRLAVDNDLRVKALELPYKKLQLSMFIVLPDELCTLEEVESKLTSSRLSSFVATARQYKDARVMLPKFKLEFDISLPKVLRSLGISHLFSQQTCDLSGMTGNKDLFISDVLHKAFVEVNEEGSEAAAATAVVVMLKCAMVSPAPPMTFVANHPFLFFIRDNLSGAILFMGRVQSP